MTDHCESAQGMKLFAELLKAERPSVKQLLSFLRNTDALSTQMDNCCAASTHLNNGHFKEMYYWPTKGKGIHSVR